MLHGPRADGESHGLVVDAQLTQATGTAERAAPPGHDRADLPGRHRITVGADKATIRRLRRRAAPPQRHAARRAELVRPARRAIDRPDDAPSRATRRASGRASGSRRRSAGSRPSRASARPGIRGAARVGWPFTLAAAAYNLIRLPKLLAAPDRARAPPRGRRASPGRRRSTSSARVTPKPSSAKAKTMKSSDFFSSLLSCSQSRLWAARWVSSMRRSRLVDWRNAWRATGRRDGG